MLTLKVTTTDLGPVELTTRPWTIRQWELSRKTKISKVSELGIGMDDMLWLAWRQLTDDGTVTVPFDAWGPTVIACDPVEDDADSPTSPAPSAG